MKSILYNRIFTPRFFILSAISLIVIYFITSLYIYPSIVSDSCWGFLVWKNWLKGGLFHHINIIESSNIAHDTSYFEATWTPGQYLIPGGISLITGIKLGYSITITNLLCIFSMLIGLYKLYTFFHFDKRIIAISLFLITLQRCSSFPFNYYIGGEILFMGSAPWLIYFTVKYPINKLINIILFTIFGLIGFILKSTFAFLFLALLFYQFIKLIIPDNLHSFKTVIHQFKNSSILKFIFLALCFLGIYLFILNKFYVSKGHIASFVLDGFSPKLLDVTFSFCSTIFATFSLYELLLQVTSNGVFTEIIYAIFLLYTFYLFYKTIKSKKIEYAYKVISISLSGSYFLFITFNLLFNNIYYEERHLRIVSLLLLPALLTLIENKKRVFNGVAIVLIGFFSMYGISSFVKKKIYMKNNLSELREKVYSIAPKDGLDYMYHLDDSLNQGNNLFFIPLPDIAYSFKNRTIDEFYDLTGQTKYKNSKYFGEVDNLYLFLPALVNEGDKEKSVLEMFQNYRFTLIYNSEKSRIFKGLKKDKNEQ